MTYRYYQDLVMVLHAKVEASESESAALRGLLNNDYELPLEKIVQLMGGLWGCSFNESTALTANAGMYQALEPIEEQIKTAVLASDVVHFDETDMRVEKKPH